MASGGTARSGILFPPPREDAARDDTDVVRAEAFRRNAASTPISTATCMGRKIFRPRELDYHLQRGSTASIARTELVVSSSANPTDGIIAGADAAGCGVA